MVTKRNDNSRSVTSDALSHVADVLSAYTPTRGIPSWRTIGLSADEVAAALTANLDTLETTVEQWTRREGALGKLPTSLLSESIMSAIIAADSVEAMSALKSAFTTVKSAGQRSDSGDALTDAARNAGDKVGQMIANLYEAVRLLSTAIPASVHAAGDERVAAYLSARDADHKADADAVEGIVGDPVHKGSTLAKTYGSGSWKLIADTEAE